MSLDSLLGKYVTINIDETYRTNQRSEGFVNFGHACVSLSNGGFAEAYVLDINYPLSVFYGQVIAVIDNKTLIVAPGGTIMYEPQIRLLTNVKSEYSHSSYLCLYEKSCGAIVYSKGVGEIKYLLLFQTHSKTWSFPKGHTELFETPFQTAKREVFEETSLTPDFKDGFLESVSYKISLNRNKTVDLFLAEACTESPIVLTEALKYAWVSSDEAASLMYSQIKPVLKKAENFILSME